MKSRLRHAWERVRSGYWFLPSLLSAAAIALAASMDGLITDDDGRVIPVDALDAIGADLESLYDTLDARDLSAGSPQARRLFS